jgi:integrase
MPSALVFWHNCGEKMGQHRQNLAKIANGKGEIYTRSDTLKKAWHVRIKYFEGSGYYIKSLKTEDKQEAMDVAEEWYRDLKYKHDNNLIVRKRTVSQVCNLYVSKLESNVAIGIATPQMLVDYKPLVETYIKPFFGKRNIDLLKQRDIEEFKAWCLAYWQTGPGSKVRGWTYCRNGRLVKNTAARSTKRLSNGSLNKICVVLRAVYNVAVEIDAIDGSKVPVITKKTGSGHLKKNSHSSRRPAFTNQEYGVLVKKMGSWPKTAGNEDRKQRRSLMRDYILILTNTGIRPGTESDALKWKDVKYVTIKGKVFVEMHINGKTGRRQLIAMKRTKDYLERIRARRASVLGKDPAQNDYVFCLPDGTHIKNDYFRKIFKRALIEFGLLKDSNGNERTPYSCRHTYATMRLLKGVTYEVLSKNMGTSYKMLEAHYSHTTPLLMRETLTRI